MKPYIKTFTGTGKINFLIISGVHGNELTPLAATKLLINSLSLNGLDITTFKSITIIQGANVDAIKKGTREGNNKTNTNDLNRAFSDEDYEPTELLKEHILKNHVVIDVHSSPNILETYLFDIPLYRDKIRFKKINFVLRKLYYKNKFIVQPVFRYSFNKTIKSYVNSFKNKVGLTLELNGIDKIDFESAEKGANILIDTIHQFSRKIKNRMQFLISPIKYVYSDCEGLYCNILIKGFQVGNNNIIGHVKDIDFSYRSSVKSNCCGILLNTPESRYVKDQDFIAMIQPRIIWP